MQSPNQRTNGAMHLLTESVSRTSRILVESQHTRQEAGFNNCNLVKPLDLNKARDYGDLGWQLHQLVKQSAPRSRQITTPTPHHSVFYRPIGLTALVILQLNVEGLGSQAFHHPGHSRETQRRRHLPSRNTCPVNKI